jgi:hypothetical protein
MPQDISGLDDIREAIRTGGGDSGGGAGLAVLSARLDANEANRGLRTAAAPYRLNTGTAADPATGEVATAGALADATVLKINDADQNGKDLPDWTAIGGKSAGLINVACQDFDNVNWVRFEIPWDDDANAIAEITKEGSVFSVPVNVVDSAGTVTDADVILSFIWG